MAINFTDLFTVIGKYIKTLNTLFGKLTEITTGLSDIEGVLEANTLNRLTVDLHLTFERMKRDVEGWTNDIIGELREVVITDRAFVRDKLVLQNTDFNSIMQEVINEMNSQAKDVLLSTMTGLTTQTSLIEGKDTVILLTDPKLDAISSPVDNALSSLEYINENSQFFMPADLFLECATAPSDGEETLRWIAKDPDTNSYKDQAESPGVSSTFPLAQSENKLETNVDFEEFVNDKPVGWNIDGTASTDFIKYNVSFRENHSLVIKGKATTIIQPIEGLEAGKGYFVSLRVSDDVLPIDNLGIKGAGNTDTITFLLTFINKNGSKSIITHSPLAVNAFGIVRWYSPSLFFVVPKSAKPEGAILSITITPFSTPSGDWIMVDEAVVSQARYFNGFAYSVTRGELKDRLEIGDRNLSNDPFTLTNDNAGVFQTFFRKAYGYQLPTAASPTIADSLAT